MVFGNVQNDLDTISSKSSKSILNHVLNMDPTTPSPLVLDN